MKDIYQNLIIEIISLQQEDVICSSPNGFDDTVTDPFEPKPFEKS